MQTAGTLFAAYEDFGIAVVEAQSYGVRDCFGKGGRLRRYELDSRTPERIRDHLSEQTTEA